MITRLGSKKYRGADIFKSNKFLLEILFKERSFLIYVSF